MSFQNAAMATAITLGGAAFMAGAAVGMGVGLAAFGTACLARRAMRRRCGTKDHGEDHVGHDDRADIAASLARENDPPSGFANPT